MKKLLKYGVASLSLATLGVVATATDLPVLGTQVVHANDAAPTVRYFVELNVYENGVFFDSFSNGRRTSPPTEEEYYRDFPNVERVIIERNEDLSTSERPYYVVSVYRVIPDEGTNPKDTATDPADGGNADTGGGNSEGGDTQAPPADNSGDTGSQDQTPPTDNSTGGDTTTSPAEAPKPQTLTVVETRQDENGAVLFTKTHSLVLNPGEEKDLGYNPDREVLVRGGNLYRYGNFEDGATLYFTTRLKPTTVDTGTPADKGAPTETLKPAPTTDAIIALGNHFKTLHDEYVRLGGDIQPGHYFSHERFGFIVNGLLAGDPAVYGAYEFDGIEKRLVDDINKLKAQQSLTGNGIVTPSAPQAGKEELAITRNQLLAQVDQSRLTDAQKGELAVKITFAKTAEELDKLKAELTSLTAPASKPAPASAAKPADQPASSATKNLPATGDLTTEALTAMGLTLVLFSLGLAKTRKTN